VLQRIIDTAERHGIAAGAHFTKWEHTQRLIEQGGRFLPFGSDMACIQAGMANFLTAAGAAVKRAEPQII
jgi:2-keto-3-deoxy-L-rhamnonate aldolase RhmA